MASKEVYHGINLSAHFYGAGEPLVEKVSIRISQRTIEFAQPPTPRLIAAFYTCYALNTQVFADHHTMALHVYADHVEVWIKAEGVQGDGMVRALSSSCPVPYIKKTKSKNPA